MPSWLGPAIVKADCIRFKADQRVVDPRFVCWWLNSARLQKEIGQAIHGVGRPRLSINDLRTLKVPLAPRPEQERIVTKLEELLSDIEAGESAINRVQALLKRYRQSVLKAAVTGELTKTWRAKNLPKLRAEKKTGADLLADILKERQEAWEVAELAKMRANGAHVHESGHRFHECGHC